LSARGGPVGRLAEFFRRGGYEVDVEDDVLWLRSDRVSGVVRVVGDDAGASELLSAVIEAARDAAAGFLAYIAAPKKHSRPGWRACLQTSRPRPPQIHRLRGL
jgi:hypothetical protein